ncbi:Spore coat associated protein JA (CotJA) [Desulfonispora thiosulfatigenes DSM 11270]|uniref:Spore coat associated protein JA (CotJA) n=1 Tax=Desulfonispora thiosulfatigenes DSM 11270 TaxID=656914 RepID=A0A1W1VHN6_DESTI|nr:spore coat associated protein CotJA [Desulfonispora thiosulfatigenes]SMB92561.1 Spore coat associated protein JA (CotJA) [Desulfonispora thiosulfatigenes DSM 11270]
MNNYLPANLRLARAYIVNQPYVNLFSPSEGLRKGTIFSDLYGL